MLKRTVAFLAVPTFAVALASAALAQQAPDESPEIPDGYLEGTWAIGGGEACGTETAEHFRFAADGTFTTVQGDQPTATGFWHLVDDKLDLHMVSSPAFFDDQLQPFAGQYTYYYAQALLFDIEDQAFRMVASMGGQLRGANLARCP
ncbi:MAG: hypothetical protein ACREJ0_06545 [Geminicoccaceae bacterium]